MAWEAWFEERLEEHEFFDLKRKVEQLEKLIKELHDEIQRLKRRNLDEHLKRIEEGAGMQKAKAGDYTVVL